MRNWPKKSSFANYHGQAGAMYHEATYKSTELIQNTVAKSRAQKFQQFVKETDTVLEYGIGKGYNLIELHCREKVGYDVAEYCRAQVEPRGIYFTSDIQEVLKWKDRFDIVICHHVLEHVSNPTLELSRIRRLLKPTGRLLLCVPFDNQRRFRRFAPGDLDMHLFAWTTQSICNLLLSMSYEIEHATLWPFGYERVLAPLVKLGFWSYKTGLWMARLVRPTHEIYVVARVGSTEKKSA